MAETKEKIEFEGHPKFCHTCGAMYDSKEGKSNKHRIVDALTSPKEKLKKYIGEMKAKSLLKQQRINNVKENKLKWA